MNKGNTLGIVIVVLAVIAVLWFFTSGRALVVSRPNPNTITASAVNAYPSNLAANSAVYTNTATQVYPYPSGKVAYVSYPIASSSSSSNYSTYYPSYPSYPPTTSYNPPSTYYPPANNYGGCYVGGCSSQLCTDRPGAVSTCEYRPEYSCYQNGAARCERQPDGLCGWTPTQTLFACLNNAR
jgi:hypothetical protein